MPTKSTLDTRFFAPHIFDPLIWMCYIANTWNISINIFRLFGICVLCCIHLFESNRKKIKRHWSRHCYNVTTEVLVHVTTGGFHTEKYSLNRQSVDTVLPNNRIYHSEVNVKVVCDHHCDTVTIFTLKDSKTNQKHHQQETKLNLQTD